MVSKMSKTLKRWNIPVPDHLDQQLEEYIEKDAFKTKSEFVRTAVRDRLEEERKKMEARNNDY
jgi:Arc/MetJ-type ribon-helix-helix transcriptional regulator